MQQPINKPTSGPWRYEAGNGSYGDDDFGHTIHGGGDDDWVIAVTTTDYDGAASEANARLIASAWEMYRLLRHMRDTCADGALATLWSAPTVAAIDTILAKAEGTQP